MLFPTGLVAIFITLISGYALYRSGSSIPKLQKYENKVQKAAKWSSAAETRLLDTRYTVGAGFVGTLLSFLSAIVYFLFVARGLSFWRIVWPAVLAGGLRFTKQYMENFWASKAMVPMMDDYNKAISENMDVINLLDGLTIGWGIMVVLKLVGL